MKHPLLITSLLLLPATVLGQPADSVQASKNVAPIAKIKHSPTRATLVLSKEFLENANDGYDLLRKLMLPGIHVNETAQTITSERGSVSVQLNGMSVTPETLYALVPSAITSIQIEELTGVSVGVEGAAIKIKMSSKAPENSYMAGVSTTQALTTALNNTAAFFLYHGKKSTLNVDYRLNYTDYKKTSSSDLSTFYLPDGTERHIDYVGLDTPVGCNAHNLNVDYTTSLKSYKLAVQADFSWKNNPYYGGIQLAQEDGKQDRLQYNRNSLHSRTPSLAIDNVFNLPQNGYIEFMFSGSYTSADYNYDQRVFNYQGSIDQTVATTALQSSNYAATGKNYNLAGFVKWKQPVNHQKQEIEMSAKWTHGHTETTFTGVNKKDVLMHDNTVRVYGQFSGTWGWMKYNVGVVGNYLSTHQSAASYNKWRFAPQLVLTTSAIKNVNIRYSSRMTSTQPLLADLTEVTTRSNTLVEQTGNADLNPYFMYTNMLQVTWRLPRIEFFTIGAYSNAPHAIMTSVERKRQDDGTYIFVFRPNNEDSYQNVTWRGQAIVHVVPNVFDLRAEVGYEFYKTVAESYTHTLNSLEYGLMADINLARHWNLNCEYYRAKKSLWGEIVTGGENGSNLVLNYHDRHLRIGVGCMLLGHPKGNESTRNVESQYYQNTGFTYNRNRGNMVYVTAGYRIYHK